MFTKLLFTVASLFSVDIANADNMFDYDKTPEHN